MKGTKPHGREAKKYFALLHPFINIESIKNSHLIQGNKHAGGKKVASTRASLVK